MTGAGPADTGGGSSQLRIEAESASSQGNFSPFVVANDATVGQYIHVPTTSQQQSSPPTKGIATYDMVIPETGTYAIWARVNAPDFNNDSFFVSIDGGAWSTWDLAEGGGWKWVKFTNRSFTAGSHQLRIAMREDGTKLDAIYLSTDLSTPPT